MQPSVSGDVKTFHYSDIEFIKPISLKLSYVQISVRKNIK